MPDEPEWLLLLPFPNGGSTAISRILRSARGVAALQHRAEGQWLIPEMSGARSRWDPDLQIDWPSVRQIWLRTFREKHPRATVVIEKSPPNLCRYRQVIDALAPMQVTLVTFSRDPYATCASWHARYGPAGIEEGWGLPPGCSVATEDDYFRSLAAIWLERARLMVEARQDADVHTTYEAFAADPAAVVAELAAHVPALATADPHRAIQVKDGPRQPVRDMNAEQIATLTGHQLEVLSEGLAEDEPALAALGYALR